MPKTQPESADQSDQFTQRELKVLEHFRRYLMSPGDMLCFSGQDIESMGTGIEDLVKRCMLVPERKKGSFSLTKQGFEAMRAIAKKKTS